MLFQRWSPHAIQGARPRWHLPNVAAYRDGPLRWQSHLTPPRARRERPHNVTILLLLGLVPTTYFLSRRLITDDDQPLNPRQFTPFILESRDVVSATSSVFTLRPASKSNKPRGIGWPKDSLIWSVQIKQPELNIARSYTPLPPVEPLSSSSSPATDHARADPLRLLVRQFPGGELSTYLSRLPVGATVSIRGPYPEFAAPDGDEIGRVVFLAGGTGISPALQLAHALLSRPEKGISDQVEDDRAASSAESGNAAGPHSLLRSEPKEEPHPQIHILWASRSSDECLGADIPTSLPHSSVSSFVMSWLGLSNDLTTRPTATPPEPNTVDADTPRSPIVQHLDALQAAHPGRLQIDYHPDNQRRFITPSALRHALESPPLSYSPSKHAPGSHSQPLPEDVASGARNSRRKRRNLILVSGPDGFVDYIAGQRVGRDLAMTTTPGGGRSQAWRQMNVGGVIKAAHPAISDSRFRRGTRSGEEEERVQWEVYRL